MKTSDQDECVLCCSDIKIYAIGVCDHPVCYQCYARMRVLCETNECPICRSNMDIVIWTYDRQPFAAISRKFSLTDRKFQICFQDAEAQKSFNSLLEYRCNICTDIFLTFNKLKDHIRREHDLHYCELCTDNLKIFPFERKIYNRKDLARHKRVGDPENTSHRGHPICEFCDQRYVDSDELFRHLRREHYFCHFCDADGKHQYYEDYDYLKVHFRKEHYLCEEGDCINEQFIGAFRTEIDLKAHIAVNHSKNKSKAEVRQARTLNLDITYNHPPRQSGSASPRGSRYHQHKRQNVEENSRDRNSSRHDNQQVEAEKINTTSTLEFPYLSEDGESRNNIVPAPTSNFNSVTLQSIGRNYDLTPQHKIDDFPALVSTKVNVTSSASNDQGQKLNISVNRKNGPARTCMSVHLSQKNAQAKISEQNDRDKDNKEPTWISKKKNTNFEEDFPKLEIKKAPVTYTNTVSVPVVNIVQRSLADSSDVPVSTHTSDGDQFVVIKSKTKKKKQNKAAVGNKCNDFEENCEEDELANKPNVFLVTNSKLLNQENKDPFRQNLVRSDNSSRTTYIEDTWQQKASFGKDDFPPLGPSEPIRKPPGLSVKKTKAPPPGFNSNTNVSGHSKPLNISLSSIARQLAVTDKNGKNNQVPQSDYLYKKPPNFEIRNQNLIEKIQSLSDFDEFKRLSGEFRNNGITAAEYYTKCLKIMGEERFYDIFPELISLLPVINKQQQLLDVHTRYKNSGGAVPKHRLPKTNNLTFCDTCYQVLLEIDYSSHQHEFD